jgi:pimeloyl-ACP methyl ester carboxylesterase
MPARTLRTSVADIAVRESAGVGPAVLMLHGNSSSSAVFQPQFDCALCSSYRLIAMDLPGHGASGDAREPAFGYTLTGYATAAVETLGQLGVARATLFGWSLGGHVALDMISRFDGVAGVMISGTPPVPGGLEGLALGFQASPLMALSSQNQWSEADAEAWARATVGPNAPCPPALIEAARRTPGEAREIFFADALSGKVDDQRAIAETSTVPLAIVNGADDPFINPDYFATVRYANLWSGEVHRLAGLGHAPFWEAPDRFNPLFERFLADVSAG